jgi:hypothetical protein
MAIDPKTLELGVKIRDAITEGYLETGKSLDVPAIAARLRWSESKLRRIMDLLHGSPEGVHAYQDHRESSSRSYPGMTVGGHRVWVYAPALWHLRNLLLAARAPKAEAAS